MSNPNANTDQLQEWINNGQAWMLEGSVGRAAMAAIEDGACVFGTESNTNYWGNVVPSRTDVREHSVGSMQYALDRAEQNDGFMSMDVAEALEAQENQIG